MPNDNELKNLPVFKKLSDASLATILSQARFEHIPEGEAIIRFGEAGHFFGVILDGRIEISRANADGVRERLNVLEKGEFFGEMSLMTGEPTTADVSALTDARVVMVPHEVLTPIVSTEPFLAATLAATISRRLVARDLDVREKERLIEAQKAQVDPYGLASFPLPSGGLILTVNCGSSSLKYRLFDGRSELPLVKGLVDRIGLSDTTHVFDRAGVKGRETIEGGGFAAAFAAMVNGLGGRDTLEKIEVVGHRVVYGGRDHSNAVEVTDEVLGAIRAVEKTAPLHIPANVAGIEEARRLIPRAANIAVFDTGFHATIPKFARIYGIPYRFFEEGIYKIGYHGTSHKFVSLQAAQFLKRRSPELKMITCHLGNGCSLAAIDHGRCVDTSLGMSTIAGLTMGTRCGDFDPGALLHIMKEHSLTPAEMEKVLMKESGLLGISGISSDMREILEAAGQGNDRALTALQLFCYNVKKYIGSFWAALGGIDVLVFTGGIGENAAEVRARVCQGLSGIGIVLDEAANRDPAYRGSPAATISADNSPVKILIVPTDEERMIARESVNTVSRARVTRVIKSHDKLIPVGVSAHHVHLSKEHVAALFGPGHGLTFHTPLYQTGQFSCKEQVDLVGPKGRVDRVRVLGPARNETQVEISRTEEFKLGIDAPIRQSGDLEGTPGLTLIGPAGQVTLSKGVICAQRHIHIGPQDALELGVRDRDVVMIQVEGERSLIFGDVVVRVNPDFNLEFHIDTDEANAAEVSSGMKARLHSIQSRRGAGR
ncbi:MAG: acetate/propionate family kinase [Thermodesulfobacteriota bacterium]